MKTTAKVLFLAVFVWTMHLSFADTPDIVTWELLGELDYQTGQMPESLQTLNNQIVEISGFIVPLESDEYIDMVKEFLLVPDPLACIHVPPPPPNQIVFVKMNKAISVDMDLRGITIKGRLSIPKTMSLDGFVSFELSGFSAKEANIDFEDPLMDMLN